MTSKRLKQDQSLDSENVAAVAGLNAGDPTFLVALLKSGRQIHPETAALLSEMLSHDGASVWTFKPVRRRSVKPSKSTAELLHQLSTGLRLAEAAEGGEKLEAAIKTEEQRTGRSRSSLFADLTFARSVMARLKADGETFGPGSPK